MRAPAPKGRSIPFLGTWAFLLAVASFAAFTATVSGQTITSVSPASQFQCLTIDILGSGFGAKQGRLEAVVSTVVDRRAVYYVLEPLIWQDDRIRARIPESVPPGDGYTVVVRNSDRERNKYSNPVPVTIRQRPRNQPPPSDAPWVERAHSTFWQGLLIWGKHFGAVGDGSTPPQGCKVMASGYGQEYELRSGSWGDERIKAWLDGPRDFGVYQVWVVTGSGPGQKTNSVPVVWRRYSQDEGGFMHIDAAKPKISTKFSPAIPRGSAVEILGNNFESPGHYGQWRRHVELVKSEGGRAKTYTLETEVLDPTKYPGYQDQGTKQWFDDYISAKVPGEAEPGAYLLRIVDTRMDRASNNIVVQVILNSAERLEIVTVSPGRFAPGANLTVRGRLFGEAKGRREVVLKKGNDIHPLSVSGWSPTQFQARTPGGLVPGRYLLAVYEDSTLNQVVDWYQVTVTQNEDIAGKKTDAAENKAGQKEVPRVPVLRTVEPQVVVPGELLTLRGDHFGSRQEGRIASLNLGVAHHLQVVEWADGQVRARVPRGLEPGQGRVLIYTDESHKTSSNSLPVTVKKK